MKSKQKALEGIPDRQNASTDAQKQTWVLEKIRDTLKAMAGQKGQPRERRRFFFLGVRFGSGLFRLGRACLRRFVPPGDWLHPLQGLDAWAPAPAFAGT